MQADELALQVPVPVTKISESEILPARIAPQLRSAESSPKADSAEEGPEETHETVAHTSAGLLGIAAVHCLFNSPKDANLLRSHNVMSKKCNLLRSPSKQRSKLHSKWRQTPQACIDCQDLNSKPYYYSICSCRRRVKGRGGCWTV